LLHDEDEYKDTVAELINQRGEDGKSPLDVAATLGRVDMSRELIQRGACVTIVVLGSNISTTFSSCSPSGVIFFFLFPLFPLLHPPQLADFAVCFFRFFSLNRKQIS
jgi:ankyrin repeat protein